MATDYISRDATEKRLIEYFKCSTISETYIRAVLYGVPPADVRPVVRAVWLAEKDGVGICSNCKRLDHIDPLATHCRYCGADMREVKSGG